MHPKNRPHVVDVPTSDFLFTLYRLLFEAKVSSRVKQMTFETATDSKDSWRVVSISQAAINHIKQNRDAKGLRRAHVLPRVERARYLFERDSPLAKDDLLHYFFEHDTVALVTSDENVKAGTVHWSTLHPVPEGYFTKGTFAIYVRKKVELPWIQAFE